MISDVKKYFIHQSELYGKDFYLDSDVDSAASAEQQSMASPTVECTDLSKGRPVQSEAPLVFGFGPAEAKLMCIGEMSNSDGVPDKPLEGAAGELLVKILTAINFSASDVYIANIIKPSSVENDDELNDEKIDYLPFLKTEIEKIKPLVILCLGELAAQSFLETSEPISDLREKEYRREGIPVFVTYHPAALLKNSELKRSVWEDVQKLEKRFNGLGN